MKINDKIKFIREKHDLKQAEFGDIVGSAQKVVSNWESGKNDPSFESIKAIATKFKISLTWLIMDEYGIDDNHEDLDALYFDAKELAKDCQQISYLSNILKSFYSEYSFLVGVKNKAKTAGAQNFFVKINEAFVRSSVDIHDVIIELSKFVVGKSVEIDLGMRDSLIGIISECSIFDKIDKQRKDLLIDWMGREISDIEAFDLLTIFKQMER